MHHILLCLTCKKTGWFEIVQLPGCTIFELRPADPTWVIVKGSDQGDFAKKFRFSVLCTTCAVEYNQEAIDELVSLARNWKNKVGPQCRHCGCYATEHKPPPAGTSDEVLRTWCPGFEA